MQQRKRPIDETVLHVLLGAAVVGLLVVGVAIARTEVVRPPPIVFPPPDFTLTLSADGRELAFTGVVDHGLTEALRAQLAANPRIERITLESNGGNIYEARGAVRTLREHRLDTHVATHCASACALVFVGGKNRRLAPTAKLGFHGYRIDQDKTFGLIDPSVEMVRDLEIYRAQAVAEAFVRSLATLAVTPMWYPDHAHLRAVGVLTGP